MNRNPFAAFVGALALCLTCSSAVSAEADVVDSSFRLPGGERVLELSVVVSAPLEEAWRMYTTADGFRTWAAPFAKIDLRVGGEYETSYNSAAAAGAPANIRNEIVALIPLRLVVIRNVQAPPDTPFDAPTFQATQTAVHFHAIDQRLTRVTLQNAVYLDGAKYDGVYKFFLAGNRWTLAKFRERFERGPVEWGKPEPLQPAAAEPRVKAP
jgi:uncharacterized protein YndB with AHSA1/START domain